MKTTSGIYQIRNTINGMRYIGSSSNIERRFKQHKNGLSKNKYENKHLQKDYNEFGLQAFKFEIIEEYEVEFLEARESFYLDKYVWDDLYNENKHVCAPMRGKTGIKRKLFTEKHKHNMSIAHMGLEASEKHKHNMSIAHTGLKASEQAKQNMSIAKTGENNPMYGKYHAPKSKQKMSLNSNNKGENNPMYGRHHIGQSNIKNSEAHKGKIYINKDNINKAIKPEFLPQYIADGWVLGAIKGTKFINKNGVNKKVNPKLLKQYINNGWVLGRISKKRGKYKKDLCNNNEILEETIIL